MALTLDRSLTAAKYYILSEKTMGTTNNWFDAVFTREGERPMSMIVANSHQVQILGRRP